MMGLTVDVAFLMITGKGDRLIIKINSLIYVCLLPEAFLVERNTKL